MAAKKSSPPFDFVVEQLKKNKHASYGEIAAASLKKGMKIYPIMYGRAKAMLGLVKSAPRGTGKASRKKAAAKKAADASARKAPASRARTTPAAKAPSAAGGAGIESVIAQVKASAAERESFRVALEKIRAILDGVL